MHPEIVPWWQGLAAATVNGRRLVFDFEQSPESPGGYAVKAYDFTDVNAVKSMDTPSDLALYSPVHLIWAGNSLFVLEQDGDQAYSLYYLKLENNSLVFQSQLPVGAAGTAIAVKGSRVVLGGSQGMLLLAITDSPYPQVVFQTTLPAGLQVKQLAFRGDQLLAIACGASCQLLSFDISNPLKPVISVDVAIPPFDSLSVTGDWIVLSGELVRDRGGEVILGWVERDSRYLDSVLRTLSY